MTYVVVGSLGGRKGNTGRDQHGRRGLREWLAAAQVLTYRAHEARRVPAVDDRGHSACPRRRWSVRVTQTTSHPGRGPRPSWSVVGRYSNRPVTGGNVGDGVIIGT